MHLVRRNVNEVFRDLVGKIYTRSIPIRKQASRVGGVLMVTEPVLVTYRNPRERVLFNPVRDANPFFHLYESLWMLAGRNHVKSLEPFNSNMKNYSDDGEIFHGAYGYRWRQWFGYDQLEAIINGLSSDLSSRREVLQMWDSTVEPPYAPTEWSDPYMAHNGGKDVPCNTHAYFAVLNGELDLTVCNRSNDLIWGMTGANVVHMSFLQEYVASKIGVKVGNYHQFTNNLHVYVDKFTPHRWLDATALTSCNWYEHPGTTGPRLGQFESFDAECARLVDEPFSVRKFQDPFLEGTAAPMFAAFNCHKNRQYFAALQIIDTVDAEDWKKAGREWIQRREESWRKSNA